MGFENPKPNNQYNQNLKGFFTFLILIDEASDHQIIWVQRDFRVGWRVIFGGLKKFGFFFLFILHVQPPFIQVSPVRKGRQLSDVVFIIVSKRPTIIEN